MKKLGRKYVLLTSKTQYDKAIDVAVAAKGIKEADAPAARGRGGYIDERGFYVSECVSEVQDYCFLVLVLGLRYYEGEDPEPQPCLVKGHLEWLCLTLFGSPLPGIVSESKEAPHAEPTTSDRARDQREEKRARDVRDAGISGARRWMTFLASRGQDPPWSNSFVSDIAQLIDLDLVKSTFVVEYLQENSAFNDLLRTTGTKSGD